MALVPNQNPWERSRKGLDSDVVQIRGGVTNIQNSRGLAILQINSEDGSSFVDFPVGSSKALGSVMKLVGEQVRYTKKHDCGRPYPTRWEILVLSGKYDGAVYEVGKHSPRYRDKVREK